MYGEAVSQSMVDIPGITGGSATEGTNWQCPYCGVPQVLTNPKIDSDKAYFAVQGATDGKLGLHLVALGCCNPECGRTTIGGTLHYWTAVQYDRMLQAEILEIFRLRPRGREKPQPDYIPDAIRKDYREACLILDLSPNASATLARRCLQGVLMDFAGVKKGLLAPQIRELRTMIEEGSSPPGVTAQSVELIDHVREFGNIGAHMETPTGLIVDVDPDEAFLLIELIETLFRDWYVERHNREKRFTRMKEMAEGKRKKVAASREAGKATTNQTAAAPDAGDERTA